MSFFKLLLHDLRCGLLRFRYLIIPLLTIIPCFQMFNRLQLSDSSGGLIDYLLYTFKGMEPVRKDNPLDQIQLPIFWMVLVGSCLFMNLDYMLNDLTNAGQQVIFRSRTRNGWFLSKCIWNMTSSILFVLVICLSEFGFIIVFGESSIVCDSAHAFMKIFCGIIPQEASLSVWQGIVASIFTPLMTIATLNILEMTLCLFVKPIISFLTCMTLLVFAVYCNSPYAIGNGAMTIRSGLITPNGHNTVTVICFLSVVILFCVVVGMMRFKHTDILGMEE